MGKGVIAANLFEKVRRVKIPVYIFQGVYDYQTTYEIAKEFYEQLDAPKKEFFTFEISAHFPMFDEIERFNSILTEVIA